MNINLLPWREEARGIANRGFWVQLSVSFGLASVILMGLTHYYERSLINAFAHTQASEPRVALLNEVRLLRRFEDGGQEWQILEGMLQKMLYTQQTYTIQWRGNGFQVDAQESED